MPIHLAICGRTGKDALVDTVSAVYKRDDGTDYVIVDATDSRAVWKTVQTGIRNSEFVQIASGLNEGESVITSGGYALPDKTQIKVGAPAEKNASEKPAADSEKGKE